MLHRLFLLCLATICVGLFSCAEPVEDIDRTQGNLVRKADLEGEWYLMQTITGVPSTTWFTFIGETSRMERVRWEVQKDLLVAYRSYPLVPGTDSPSTDREFDGTENPVAAYTITSHVDVQRDYNPSTGEQSNVLVENTSDRQWFEREYVRVDWSASRITNFDFIAPTQYMEAGYFVPEEQGQQDPRYKKDAFYRETDDAGSMNYFDVLGKLIVTPDFIGCIYTWWGYAAEDCAAGEIEVRTSFSLVPKDNDYEAFHYDDQLMSRFGYFRTEYFTYDEQRGITDQGRRYMINRHNIWKASRNGEEVIPVPQREIRTVPYYLSTDFPDDPLLLTAAKDTMAQWNSAMRGGLDALGVTDESDVFVLCQNPVAEEDHDACGDVGFAPRIGDLRYSTLHWVDTETLAGLLGYGPSGADPISGEVISGKAYVYGAAVSTWATYAVDVIRYFNGDLDLNTLVTGHHFIDDVLARLETLNTTVEAADGLDRAPLRRPISRPNRPARPNRERSELKAYNHRDVLAKIDRAKAAGGQAHAGNVEVQRALARSQKLDWDALPEDTRARLDPTVALNPVTLKQRRDLRRAARTRGVDFHDLVAPDIEGLVQSYAGRTDYEAMWREIRAEIFSATAEHEVGHTLGLRHNFQGSYDSVNFHEEYWQLRQENLFPADSLGDVYRLTTLTEEQHRGHMRQHQYSSVMDYGYTWQNDLAGLGKYDRAALVFGYTAGSYPTQGAQCEDYPSVPTQDGCLAKLPGLVEVFKKRQTELGRAGEILGNTEDGFTYDDPGLPSITALERYHYTTLALGFPALDDMLDSGREWMNYADFLSGKAEDNRVVRVPYLFCSDEWESGLVSCHAFDQGADPFEIVRTKTAQYRAYYPFVNFRMDRPFFEVWHPLDSYFYRVFLPLSDVFQSWYVAPWGDDDLFDRTYDLAITSGFNLLAEVLGTPPYGQWCENNSGDLIHLSDERVLQGDVGSESSECAPDGRRVYVPPGEGRRRFSIYDVNSGYYFPDKPQEAGHYWATLAAIWAITDPEAYVLGVDGDAGTYAISFYDWFTDEFTSLMNDLLTKDFAKFSPRAVLSSAAEGDGTFTAQLQYQPRIPIFNADTGAEYDPETGKRANPSQGGRKSMCESCQSGDECLGYTGRLGGVYCEPIAQGEEARHCLKDCSYGPDSCPTGTICRGNNCVPEDAACGPLVQPCSIDWPFGQCAEGRCLDGTCTEVGTSHPVKTERTFMLATDIIWYGFLFTTSSYSTAFNDQLNVFRPGTTSQVEVTDEDAAARISFTNPVSGVSYAAVQSNCPELDRFVLAGERGLCSPCEDDRECAGYNGEYGGTWCQPMDGFDGNFCLTDCSEDENNCDAGEVCDDRGNCVPENEAACREPRACNPRNPLGSCAVGSTCIEGSCVPASCLYGNSGDIGAVRLVKRGQELASAYNQALSNWYRFDDDEAQEAAYGRAYYRARYELQDHIDLLETLLATYTIFGRVY